MKKFILWAIVGLIVLGVIGNMIGSGKSKADDKPVATATPTATATATATPADDNAPTEDDNDSTPTEDPAGPKQTVKGLNEWGSDHGMKVKVMSMEKVNSIPAVNEFSDPVVDKAGSSLIAVHMEVKNNSAKAIDPLCGGGNGFVMLDGKDRNFDPLDSLLDINDNVCDDGIQPGFKSSYTLAFRLPGSAKVGGLVVWNSDDENDYDGEKSELIFAPWSK